MAELNLRPGEWVEVRSKGEILKTLDQDGRLEGMPFMPEMFDFCGKRLRVYKRAHKTCDTVFPVRSRWVANAVHLETRCDGKAHGGCQAGCLIFWKEAWLKQVSGVSASDPATATTAPTNGHGSAAGGGCTEEDVYRNARARGDTDESDPTFVCQATQLPYATKQLHRWDVRQYVQDFTSGNVGLGKLARGFVYMAYQGLIKSGIGLGRPLRWFYDVFQGLWGGLSYPRWHGKIPVGERTPTVVLDLQVGELVRTKSYQEILATCDETNKNRGMGFDGEMVPYCGKTYRVQQRVTRIINEKTGKVQQMKNPCIILEGVVCQARYSHCRMFCPRGIYLYWREIWLERIDEGGTRVSSDAHAT